MNVCKSIDVALAIKGETNLWLAKQIGILDTSLSSLKHFNSTTTARLEKLANAFDMKVSTFISLGET